jgi:hypothetical protein
MGDLGVRKQDIEEEKEKKKGFLLRILKTEKKILMPRTT